jgi:hypothetical protein
MAADGDLTGPYPREFLLSFASPFLDALDAAWWAHLKRLIRLFFFASYFLSAAHWSLGGPSSDAGKE